MSNSELIDCTREREKLKMRQIKCKKERNIEGRLIKGTIDCVQGSEVRRTK